MTITPQGRSFLTEAQSLLSAAARLEGGQQPDQKRSVLRLGCFSDLAPLHLAPALRLLRQSLPEVQVTYEVASFEGVIAGLIDGKTDLAITYGLSMDAGFTCHVLYHGTPYALVAHDHDLARQDTVTLADLAPYSLILSDEGLSAQHILTMFKQNGLRPSVAHRAASLEIQRSLAAHGEGVGVSYSAPPGDVSYDRKRLVSLPITNPDAAEDVVLTRHGTGPAAQLVTAAESLLINQMKKT